MKENVTSLKTRNQAEVKEQIRLVNGLVGNISWQCKTISEVNQLLYAYSFVVADGQRKGKVGERRKKTYGGKEGLNGTLPCGEKT